MFKNASGSATTENGKYNTTLVMSATSEKTEEKKRSYYTLDDIWNLPSKEYTLQDWFGKGDVGMIFGDSAAGKTFVAVDMMVSAMLGGLFANRFQFNERMKVLYACGEGFHGAVDRVKARLSLQKLPGDIKEFFFISRDVPNLSNADVVEAFIKEYRELGIGLIFIDTLNIAAYGANENDSATMGLIFSNTQKIAKELNATVILLHHANKSNGGYRGSTAIKASCDIVVKIEANNKIRTMHCDKLKDGEEWQKQEFSLKGIDLFNGGRSAVIEWLAPGETNKNFTAKDAVFEFLKNNAEEWFSYKEIHEELANEDGDTPLKEDTVKRACNELTENGKLDSKEDIRQKGKKGGHQAKVYRYKKGAF